MKAMILAAGEGRRMRPLTSTTPKPLLEVGGRALLEHHILNLSAAGFSELVVNAAYLGQQIADFCGDGSRWGVQIQVSLEPEPLETAGGIIRALPLLAQLGAEGGYSLGGRDKKTPDKSEAFLVVNGDIYCPYPFESLAKMMPPEAGAHLVMVPNPAHNPAGDFCLDALDGGRVTPPATNGSDTVTFAGIGVYTPSFFDLADSNRRGAERGVDQGVKPRANPKTDAEVSDASNLDQPKKLSLKPLLDAAIARNALTGELWRGQWADVGTPERLRNLDTTVAAAMNP